MSSSSTNIFTTKFINEMYAILLGIGISNILFDNASNFSIISTAPSLILGIFVLITYWYDWTNYIEDDVSSSKAELLVDFGILICLELLFVFHNQIDKLPLVFIYLASFDLLWVVNFYRENKNSKKVVISNIKAWLFEKVATIILYTINYLILCHTILQEATDILKTGLLILVFFLARRLCFNQCKSFYRINFLPCEEADLSNILELHNSNTSKDSKSFLLSNITGDDLLHSFSNPKEELYVVKNNSTIIAYVHIASEIPIETLQQVNFINSIATINNENLMYIKVIAIDKSYQKSGIGKLIYKTLLEKYSLKDFYAFVAAHPYNNVGSTKFHKKMGFKIIGEFSNSDYQGIKNYKSHLFCKKAENSELKQKQTV